MADADNKAVDILVVDDNRMNRVKLGISLQQQGYQVAMAENGKQALEIVRQKPFDLVLLDIVMPEMDGYQVLAALKNDNALRNIPVIVISAAEELDAAIKCISMGAEDYLAKPFDPVLLKARLGASLRKKWWHDQEQAYLRQLQCERQKSEALLLNILPKAIAEQLKDSYQQDDATVIAQHCEEVTVIFADIVHFTELSSNIAATSLVLLLNNIFSCFDRLAEKYGLEKIKTIGDAYMVAGGIPVARPDHAQAAAEMALDMQQEIGKFTHQGSPLSLRIGMCTGPVVAGVIGRKKFSYDLWGDTVNTASRMESHGTGGRIQLTASSYQKLQVGYVMEKRGVIAVKGKGEMETYWLLGRKT